MTTQDEQRALIERLTELLAGCSALPLTVRPQELDDWGVIRSSERTEHGYQRIFARAQIWASLEERNEHRRAGTDPTQAHMDLIAEGLNALPALLTALSAKAPDTAAIPEGMGECPVSPLPSGKHQLDTSMESGPNNCFFCDQPMGGR